MTVQKTEHTHTIFLMRIMIFPTFYFEDCFLSVGYINVQNVVWQQLLVEDFTP